jgi:parallel beta-helix repeat protein
VKSSNVSGLRFEHSFYSIIENNLFYENDADGITLYGFSNDNNLSNNIVIDNNKENFPLAIDWRGNPRSANSSNPGISEEFYRLLGNMSWGYAGVYEKENGHLIFLGYGNQQFGEEIELRNRCNNNFFKGNVVGRYRTFLNSLGWQSPVDFKTNYAPIWSATRHYLSSNNVISSNYFLNSDSSRIIESGCDNVYSGNKNVVFKPTYKEETFSPSVSDWLLCSQATPCIVNGNCEPEKGETIDNCAADCKCITDGNSGYVYRADKCCNLGLDKTMVSFPANHGIYNGINWMCNNTYDTKFYCTDCGDGNCDDGESVCSCPVDCTIISHCGDGKCERESGESCAICSADCGAC